MATFDRLLRGVYAQPTLRTLRLVLHDCGMSLERFAAVAQHLGSVGGLLELTIDAALPG